MTGLMMKFGMEVPAGTGNFRDVEMQYSGVPMVQDWMACDSFAYSLIHFSISIY